MHLTFDHNFGKYVDRFTKFFHCPISEEILYTDITNIFSISPKVCFYTTLSSKVHEVSMYRGVLFVRSGPESEATDCSLVFAQETRRPNIEEL